jgi:hypothetical protein
MRRLAVGLGTLGALLAWLLPGDNSDSGESGSGDSDSGSGDSGASGSVGSGSSSEASEAPSEFSGDSIEESETGDQKTRRRARLPTEANPQDLADIPPRWPGGPSAEG